MIVTLCHIEILMFQCPDEESLDSKRRLQLGVHFRERERERERVRKAERQTDKQTDTQTDRELEKNTDRQLCR